MSLQRVTWLIGFCSLFVAHLAAAVGLGELSVRSTLNQAFSAEVQLTNVRSLGEEEILVTLAPQEEFVRNGLERHFFYNDFRFEVVLSGEGAPKLLITSHEIIREPFLSFLVEVRWPTGRFQREYTVLMEKPAVID